MTNKERPHVLVLPEDDANRQLANGFHIEVDSIRQFRVLPVARGWQNVLDQFAAIEAPDMRRWPGRSIILAFDFDGRLEDRLQLFRTKIPQDLADRTFLLGTLTEPEDLKKTLGNYEAIGTRLARDCRERTEVFWEHELLRHNIAELRRMAPMLRPILFRDA